MSARLAQEIEHLTTHVDAIIREQAGGKVFHRLDRIRRLATDTSAAEPRQSPGQARDHRSPACAEAYQIAHAFSLFFQLTNFCEERARVRHLREHATPAMSLRGLFQELREAGVGPETLQRCLDELEIQPVLTAHPTEAKRRATLAHVWRLAEHWDNPEEVLEALWQTEEVRERHVGPLQEVENAVCRASIRTCGNFLPKSRPCLKIRLCKK